MIPRERGLKGLSIFIIFYLPIIDFMEKSGYMSFLGEAMWFLISCNYINIPCGFFGGVLLLLLHSLSRCSGFTCSYSFTLLHPSHSFIFGSLILANSCALGLSMEMNGWKRRAIARWL
jgi:hypothetical protein